MKFRLLTKKEIAMIKKHFGKVGPAENLLKFIGDEIQHFEAILIIANRGMYLNSLIQHWLRCTLMLESY